MTSSALSMEGISQVGSNTFSAQLYCSPTSSSNGSVWSDVPATSFNEELQQALNNSLRGWINLIGSHHKSGP